MRDFPGDSGRDGQNEAVALEFRVLGPVEVTAGEKPVALGSSRPLIVLAGLLLRRPTSSPKPSHSGAACPW
jgi:hypothetical protein